MPDDQQPFIREGSSWTVDSLHEHVLSMLREADERYQERWEMAQKAIEVALSAQKSALDAALTAQKSAVDASFSAQKEAVLKAEAANEKRFEAVNEFRSALGDTARQQLLRTEAEIQFKALGDRIESIDRVIADRINVAMARINTVETNLVTLIKATEGNFVGFLTTINARLDKAENRGGGLHDGWGVAIGAVGFIIAVIAIVERLIGK